jgi:hypothetical protein
MKFRLWVSLTLALSFIVLSISGLLAFFLPYNRTTAAIHSIFGFFFFLSVMPHIWNNFKSLKNYIAKKDEAP